MKRLTIFLQKWGIHCILLPVFFVIHNYNQYYGLVSSEVALLVFIKIIVLFLLFFILIYFFLKDINKSSQITTLLGAIFLFYGVLKDFLQLALQINFISKYTVLLPLLFIISIILIRLILKKTDHKKCNLFLNLLLIIFILIDTVTLLYSNNSFLVQQNLLTKGKNSKLTVLPIPDSKPDIYYLVFDSYPGNVFLKDFMNFDNSKFNTSLKEKGFYVVETPKSNYVQTVLSISSTLNFEYLENINLLTRISPKLYNQAKLTIKQSIVPNILKNYNYSLYNLSVFDISSFSAIRNETFLTMPESNILIYNTLIERLKKDVLWNLIEGKYSIPAFKKLLKRKDEELVSEEIEKRNFNNTVIDSLLKIPVQEKGTPKFVYAHLYLPHPPFFYDENGKMNDFNYVINEESQKDKQLFISYLKYTNSIILDITNKIIQNSDNNAVIVLQSDHGFRDFEGGLANQQMFFYNYSAFYFPDKNYSTLYKTISNINTFPILFNKYFDLKIPLLRDSSIAIPY